MIFRQEERARSCREGIFDNRVPLGDLFLGRGGEFRESPAQHWRFVTCLRLKIINIPEGHILGWRVLNTHGRDSHTLCTQFGLLGCSGESCVFRSGSSDPGWCDWRVRGTIGKLVLKIFLGTDVIPACRTHY